MDIEVGTFVDKRPKKDSIGDIRDGMGIMVTSRIQSKKPVTEVVREAFVEMLRKNGHRVVSSNQDISVSGSVTNVWIDFRTKMASVETIATVTVDLNVVDEKTGAVLLSRLTRATLMKRACSLLVRTTVGAHYE